MIEVRFGSRIRAVCNFRYEGDPGYFTFAQEIGTIIVGFFKDFDRWEEAFYVTEGNGQITMEFILEEVDGLNLGDIYNMNFEIGTGSQSGGDWVLIERKYFPDEIKIIEEEGVFKNLSAVYSKA